MDTRLFTDLIHQWWQTRRLQDRMHHDLPDHFREEWQELPWRRYAVFYGVLVPVVIHHALIRIHDIPISQNMRKVIAAQALVTGLFDDLFDRLHLTPQRIRQLIETPDYIISSEYIEEHLCQYLYREIDEYFTGNPKALENSVQGIIKAQQESFHQRNPDIPIEEILRITREKGGQAVLFYRSCIDRRITEAEKAFLYDLGELFQMTNDINDVRKDRDAGELTIMTMGRSLREIRKIFETRIRRAFESWDSLQDDLSNPIDIFPRINILLARSLVTLDRYQQFCPPDLPFNIEMIPPRKQISGLNIPTDIRTWYRYYKSLKDFTFPAES